MILIVNVCAEKLHYFEFVQPIEDIVGEGFVTRHYSEVKKKDLDGCDKVIICGTSLADSSYLDDLEKFSWLRDFDKPVLGICAGFQIIGLVFSGKVLKKTEIGFFRERFDRDFLGLSREVEVYHLHNNYISGWGDEWEVFCGPHKIKEPSTRLLSCGDCTGSDEKRATDYTDLHGYDRGIVQAVRHKEREIYGVLFHPEVRNKEMVREFLKL